MKKIILSNPFQFSRCFFTAVFSSLLFTVNTLSAQEAPILEWAKAPEGSNTNATSVAIDGSGNVYTTGSFAGITDFDPGPSVYNLSPGPGSGPGIFISKLDANGNFIWARAIERSTASGQSEGKSIAVTGTGDIYISGDFTLTADFDPGPAVFDMVASDFNADIFILKLDANGNFVWALRFGSTYLDYGNAIATDASGNVYAAGLFENIVDFDPGPGVLNLGTSGSSNKAFIIKLDSNGNLIWAKALIGTTFGSGGGAESIFIDATNNAHITGSYSGSVDFDPGAGILTFSTGWVATVFVAKLNSDGDLVWAKSMNGWSEGYGLSVDLSGNVLTTGVFVNVLDVDPGAGTTNLTSVANSGDIFISKLDINGNFVWGKGIGGTTVDHGRSIATDAVGNVYTTGFFYRTVDFDPGAGVFNLTPLGGVNDDFFISKLDNNGNFVWAVSTGGINRDRGNSIRIDPSGVIYVAGFYQGGTAVDFDFGPCVLNLPGSDSFVEKIIIGTVIPPPVITSFTPTIGPIGTSVIITGTNFSAIPTGNVVTFFNNRTATVTASTATSITTTVPSATITGKISVTTNCITVTSATDFTIGAALLPTITSFTPASGLIGTTVTITGTNFSTTPVNNTVRFNGTTGVVTASTATSITTTVPPGATTGTITVTVAGNTATSATNFSVTAGAVITINPQPASTAVCAGAIVNFTLSATGTTNLTYQWQKFNGTAFVNISNGGGYSGTTTSTLNINTTGNFGAGDYRCSVSGDLATSVFSQTASLTFTTNTTLAEITINGNIMTASDGDSYQWYQNDDMVVDATGQSFEFNSLEYGLYKVDVTENGCTSTSLPFEYLITSLENFSSGIKLYPNPVEENLFVEFKPPYEVEVIGVSGNVVRIFRIESASSSLDFSSIAKGIYFLKIKNENQTQYLRIIKK